MSPPTGKLVATKVKPTNLLADDIIIACVYFEFSMQGTADEGGLFSVMGPTGAGKSRVCRLVKRSFFFLNHTYLSVRQFIDIATQQAQSANVGHSLESCTSEVRAVRYQRTDGNGKRSYVIVDTPGFDDTNKPDTEILALIADWLKTTYVFGILSRLRYLTVSVTNKTCILPESSIFTEFPITGWLARR
jgi:hypothetical protein